MKNQTEPTEQCLHGALELYDGRIGFYGNTFRLQRAAGWINQVVEQGLQQLVGKGLLASKPTREKAQVFDTRVLKEQALTTEQAMRYAEDLTRIYQEEKAKRAELKKANEKLTAEITKRQRVQEELHSVISELTIAQQALRHQADHDPLTGLLNRGAAFKRLNTELDRSEREGRPLAVIMADLDHFKQVNDTLGHAGGDAVLKEIAERIRSCVRTYDLAARYGGEEILVVLPGCGKVEAISFAERLRLSISEQVVQTDRDPIRVTLSLGVTWVDGQDRCDPDSVIRDADAALYTAKESGRNCTIVTERRPSRMNNNPAARRLVA